MIILSLQKIFQNLEKIGDSEDRVLLRMRRFYCVCLGISTVLALLAFIFI